MKVEMKIMMAIIVMIVNLTNIMTCEYKLTNFRDYYLVKKGPKKSGRGLPPPLIRAMPKRTHSFSWEVLPYKEILCSSESKMSFSAGNIWQRTCWLLKHVYWDSHAGFFIWILYICNSVLQCLMKQNIQELMLFATFSKILELKYYKWSS